jgi:hypothetical protein
MADSYFKKLKKRLKENKQDRSAQFANYLNMIDNLESKKFYSRRGRVENPGTNLRFTAGTVRGPSTTKMSTVLDKYHAKALRLAQAKYYAKQTG